MTAARRTKQVRSRPAGRRAFTLVEMLIVIGVILLLTALTAMVTAGFVRSSAVRETENTMRVLESALTEWELAADRRISYGAPDVPVPGAAYDIDQAHIETAGGAPNYHFNDTIFELLGILNRTKSARDITANIDPEFLLQLTDPDDPGETLPGVRDPWDTPFRVVFPGRTWVDGVDPLGGRDPDGSIRTLMENVHGIAVDRRPYFISAGPDGNWGHLHLTVAASALDQQQRADVEAAADNISSYETLRSRP